MAAASEKPQHGGHNRKHPWYELKVGESFVLPHKRNSVQARASRMQKPTGFTFSVSEDPAGWKITRVL